MHLCVDRVGVSCMSNDVAGFMGILTLQAPLSTDCSRVKAV